MGGEERQLLPGLIIGREDLHDECGRSVPNPGCSRAVKPSVGHAKVVLGLAEVELAHRGTQPRRARRRSEQLRELLADVSMLDARAGNHVADTLPHLVETVDTRLAATLEQRFELRWRRAEDQCRHRPRVPAATSAQSTPASLRLGGSASTTSWPSRCDPPSLLPAAVAGLRRARWPAGTGGPRPPGSDPRARRRRSSPATPGC